MFKTIFWVILLMLILTFILIFYIRCKRDKVKNKKLAFMGVFISALFHVPMCILYFVPSMEQNIEGMLINLALGTYLPTIIVPILLLAPIIITAVISIIVRKASALKITSIWTGLLVSSMAISWIVGAFLVKLF